ncbi:Beta-galactosidase [Fusarium keratoplasticum]|uniref:Beta-galactosidase n=1 Tax=Fusarium keratoplasticum TaxID=1328300 RepID=A0ACC0R2A2_9HYPO|nr:Beta-galactosidase [Fusarium keratoplasticum]KAI8674425.1 Beta-galactosidase [Fusarium keratoplasticum]
MKLLNTLLTALGASLCCARTLQIRGGRPFDVIQSPHERDVLQDIVTWDEHSLFINGERVTIFSAEIHPFRLPVPSLYLDLFQKVKAAGFNMVSFYVDWALLEGKPGEFRSEGVLAIEPFIDAAKEAGIFLLARPGPYINAEASGGGFPGWLQRVKGTLRTNASDYLSATDNYMEHICSIIAKAQITNGGPVILFQPENEYSAGDGVPFPSHEYLKYVNDQARNAGIVVPLINNDAWQGGTGAPGSGIGAVDIYGHDGYPAGFDCANPHTWPKDGLPTTWHAEHMQKSPNTPYSIIEFQGGAFDPPGGGGFENCYVLTNHEFARVFYKNNLAAGVTIFNIYMTFGGTNWGNLGHCDGYTSYDYGAAIKEDRSIDREKYSEIKLQGQFLRVSPSYATATPGNRSTSRFTDNEDIAVTPLTTEKEGSFFVVRHADFTSTESSSYKLKLPTSAGTLAVPQLGGSLSLNGRDSKIHVADYAVGEHTVLYSTAEVLTWKKFGDKTVLILYGGPDELHEVAITGKSAFKVVEGSGVKSDTKKNANILQWKTSSSRRVVQRDSLFIYLLDRNSAYKYWVPDLPGKGDRAAYGTSVMNPDSVIINGPQLVRSISIQGSKLSVQADFNISSTPLEIIGAPKGVSKLVLNGKELRYEKSKLGNWIAQRDVELPIIKELDLSSLDWNYVDSLPEIKKDYNDAKWTVADKTTTNNTRVPLQNTVSLYGSDYGFHAGALIYRGHFTADGSETQLKLWTQGGRAFATAVWLDDKFLGSFTGNGATGNFNSTYELPKLQKGRRYVVTVVVDNTGLNGNWTPGYDEQKSPRGILDWALVSKSGRETPIAKWKLTGNLGGEDYVDIFRGPLNEGGFYFERQGYHLPSPPLKRFKKGSPFKGIEKAGVAFYTAKLGLDYPSGQFDIPLSFTFKNTTDSGPYRALLFVNGFQFGRYVSSIGPQTVFPVPEGVLNYQGDNWIGVSIWALEGKGAKLPGLRLTAGAPVQTGRQPVKLVQGPKYSQRSGAY